ncbi:hypothetical protein PM082_006524 [Marasmius tenuissimus]|nr:hypothetical protein PM082_006524 [Marasmius tenuissimus]
MSEKRASSRYEIRNVLCGAVCKDKEMLILVCLTGYPALTSFDRKTRRETRLSANSGIKFGGQDRSAEFPGYKSSP